LNKKRLNKALGELLNDKMVELISGGNYKLTRKGTHHAIELLNEDSERGKEARAIWAQIGDQAV